LCLVVSFPCNSSKIIKGEGLRVHLHNGEHQRVVVGGSAGTKRRAAVILSDFGFKAKPGAPSRPSGEVEQRLLPPLLGGSRAKGQEGAGARVPVLGRLGCLVPQEGMELDTIVSGSAGKRATAE
jgi:hypothetical protein